MDLPLHVRMVLVVYNICWCGLLIGWLLVRLLRWPFSGCGTVHQRVVRERLGWLPIRPKDSSVGVWIHAAAIGEFLAARPVMAALKARHPDWWIVLTMCNARDYALARAQASGTDALCLLPWDLRGCVDRALARSRPDCLILVECELWPNLIARAARRQVRIVMLNARIYERDWRRYRLGRSVFGPILRLMTFIAAQSEDDRRRFLCLGSWPDRVACSGNTKFDVELPADLAMRLAELRRILPMKRGPLWVLASTHAGEEEAIFTRLQPLRQKFPGLQLLVAPRQVERAASLEMLGDRHGLSTLRRSRLSAAAPSMNAPDLLILDSLGELPAVLGLADLVFVGGSLVDKGGHNPIEAARHAKAILLGPWVDNFREVVASFVAERAVVQVSSADELLARALDLLADPWRRQELGDRAAAVVERHRGSAGAFAHLLERSLKQAA